MPADEHFSPVPFSPVPFSPVPFSPVPFSPVPFSPVPFSPVPFSPVPITTARLTLWPLRESDAAEMAVVLGDEQLHEFIGGRPAEPGELADRYRKLVVGSGQPDELWLNWTVRLGPEAGGSGGSSPLGSTAVGTVQATITVGGASPTAAITVGGASQAAAIAVGGASPVAAIAVGGASPVAAIAWVIGVPWQGNGYASEAARALVSWMAARRPLTIIACIHRAHQASQRVAARAGLTPTDRELGGEQVWELVLG